MKLAYSAIAALVAGTLAAPSPWCFQRFHTCGKRETVSTATIQEREALPEPKPLPWCLRVGEVCTKRDAIPEPGPEPWCMKTFTTCGRKRDTIETSFPDQPSNSYYGGLLKRAAYGFIQGLQSTPALADRELSHEADLSNLPGGAAYQAKRGVGELSDLISVASSDPASISAEHDLGREFEPDSITTTKREAAPRCHSASTCGKSSVRSDREHCREKNEACYKAMRTAEAVLYSIGDMAARDVTEDKEMVEEEYKAKREVLAIQEAARDLLGSLE